MKRILIALLIVYVGGYGLFRTTNAEVWAKDSLTYVIFPDSTAGRLAYYAWRPLTYLDSALFKMRFHIGPHQETTT